MFMLKSTHERILAEQGNDIRRYYDGRLLQNNTDHMNLRNQMLAEYRADAEKWRAHRAKDIQRKRDARKAAKVAK